MKRICAIRRETADAAVQQGSIQRKPPWIAGGSLQDEASYIGRADLEYFPFGRDQHVLMAVPLEFPVEQIAFMQYRADRALARGGRRLRRLLGGLLRLGWLCLRLGLWSRLLRYGLLEWLCGLGLLRRLLRWLLCWLLRHRNRLLCRLLRGEDGLLRSLDGLGRRLLRLDRLRRFFHGRMAQSLRDAIK